MRTLQEIQQAVRQLPAEELAPLRVWFAEFRFHVYGIAY